jgi:hypothetical protein
MIEMTEARLALASRLMDLVGDDATVEMLDRGGWQGEPVILVTEQDTLADVTEVIRASNPGGTVVLAIYLDGPDRFEFTGMRPSVVKSPEAIETSNSVTIGMLLHTLPDADLNEELRHFLGLRSLKLA